MKLNIPKIPEEDTKNPTVNMLVEFSWNCLRVIQELTDQIAALKDEIAKLKGQKPRPKLPPSKTADDAKNKCNSNNSANRTINHEKKEKIERIIKPNYIPEGSIFKGYEDYSVQDLVIKSQEIQFRLAIYIAPDGSRIRGELPEGYTLGHFGTNLIAYCLSQYYQCHITRPLLLTQLHDMGIDISSAQLSNILIKNKEAFHNEKQEVLKAGLENSPFLNTDDTGARHDGKNGYCTSIGSPLFTYFESTESKSRINFLEILQGAQKLYAITEEALNYAFEHGIGYKALDLLENHKNKQFKDKDAWQTFLKKHKIIVTKDQKIATEAALLGGALIIGFNPYTIIISDGAGQFILSLHGLCWVHEERHYRKLIPLSKKERLEIEKVRSAIWDYYEDLKEYKKDPKISNQEALSKRFDNIFGKKYKSTAINELLAHTRSRKEGLLLVLKYPFIPLHNNDSERDIREYVKKRKISGSTRSNDGRQARDTFTSLKKTCMKLKICFYDYLKDRLANIKKIPKLEDLIKQKSNDLSYSLLN